jgi:lysylphosphatidylglycerol synthetase-like protein (DUF2156 family)/UDP-2,3-diacylglucosamine pyrophosphatase LpxH
VTEAATAPLADAVVAAAVRSNGRGEPAGVACAPDVPDRTEVAVPKGARTVVVSDLHLPTVATETSRAVEKELSDLLDQWVGPGVFVIAGDGFELLAGPPDVDRVLDAHPHFTQALLSFAGLDDRRVVILPGNHDGRLAWDDEAVAVLRRRIGVSIVSLAVDLVVETDAGTDRVRVVHGNQLDPYNTFEDPRSPVDTPLGHHVVQQLLPELEARQRPGSLLDGVQWLDGDLADFVGSRLLYRKVVGKLWLIAIPFLAALVLRFLAFFPGVGSLLHHHAQRWLIGLGLLVALMVVVATVAAVSTMLRVNRALRESVVSMRADPATHNSPARSAASRLVTEGYAGLVSGHTHEPELSVTGNGFYANTGSGTESVVARPSRLRLPRPFVAVRRVSYVDLRCAGELEVRLFLREVVSRSPSFLERLAMRHTKAKLSELTCVASLPHGPTWPVEQGVLSTLVRRRRVRRVAAALLVVAGLLNIVFALVWSVPASVERWLPVGLHPLSGTAAIVGGLALTGLARGVRYGFRGAWLAALVVLLASTIDRLVQGHGLEGSIIACVFGLWLVAEHQHFNVSPAGVARFVGWLIAGGLAAVAIAAFIAAVFIKGHHESIDAILLAVLGVLVMATLVALPGRETRRTGAARRETFARTRATIDRFGGGTLDYFALRDDKSWFFTGRTVVSYSVINGVMLVSPDPIGPVEERASAWLDTMDFCESHGWHPSVLAASDAWLPIYRASGLVDHYIGDEAVVDCPGFSLKGKEMKSLRGAYNRMKKGGFRVDVLDPLEASNDLRRALLELMTETRQGEVERGYSMTLSRMFDARDTGLLLAVCFDAEGRPVAFNQYVPALQVKGYSLDVMRRTANPDAPNGLTDFVIIETIAWMTEHGFRGLGLNFATMREIVADETSRGGPWMHMEKSVLHHFSDTMQIESLWRFNKKYDPAWVPRYAVTGAFLRIAGTGLAIARAEAVTELPVVGHLLHSREPASTGE